MKGLNGPADRTTVFAEGGFAHRVVLSVRRGTFFGDAMRSIRGRIRNFRESAAPQEQLAPIEPRFFISHGVVHDGGRRHIYTKGELPFENCLETACTMLNTLSGPPPFSSNSRKAASLAASIDAALSSAPQSVGVMDKRTAELIFLGPEVAGVLREIASSAFAHDAL